MRRPVGWVENLSLWAIGTHEALNSLGPESVAIDEFLEYPVVELALRRRLDLYQERRDFYRRQTQLENLLRENASQDPLTRLPNRHFAMQHLQLQWQLFRRKSIPFCCVLCDLPTSLSPSYAPPTWCAATTASSSSSCAPIPRPAEPVSWPSACACA